MREIFKPLLIICFLISAQIFGYSEREAVGKDFIYESFTMDKMSRLYWVLDLLDLENDDHIDNFMMINECDIYRDYFNHEFEWRGVRESGRDFIKNNRSNFALRFDVILPLKLGEYNFENEAFEILDEYKIRNMRRFEALSEGFYDAICKEKYESYIEGYPRGILVELNRPIFLDVLPMDADAAKEYITQKMKLNINPNKVYKSKHKIYDARDAYLVLKIKFFSGKKAVVRYDGSYYNELLAVIDGLKVYSDSSRETLLYEENYHRKKKVSEMEQRLKDKFAERRRQELRDTDILGSETVDKDENP